MALIADAKGELLSRVSVRMNVGINLWKNENEKILQ